MLNVNRKNAGLTLTELIIVMAILGALAGVGAYGYIQYQEDARKKACVEDIRTLVHATLAFNAAKNRWPQVPGGYGNTNWTAGSPAVIWDGWCICDEIEPYTKMKTFDHANGKKYYFDPWGNPFYYIFPGYGFNPAPNVWKFNPAKSGLIVSFGPDKSWGTPDDIFEEIK